MLGASQPALGQSAAGGCSGCNPSINNEVGPGKTEIWRNYIPGGWRLRCRVELRVVLVEAGDTCDGLSNCGLAECFQSFKTELRVSDFGDCTGLVVTGGTQVGGAAPSRLFGSSNFDPSDRTQFPNFEWVPINPPLEPGDNPDDPPVNFIAKGSCPSVATHKFWPHVTFVTPNSAAELRNRTFAAFQLQCPGCVDPLAPTLPGDN